MSGREERNEIKPPRFALRFLQWFCPRQLHEGIEGDLLEAFETDRDQWNGRWAQIKFIWRVIKFFRPAIILRRKFKYQNMNTIMIKNYVKVGLRSMMKRKFYSFVNAFGLSIAMAFCILVYLFIQDEKSFDQFHENKDLIYRIHATKFSKEAFEKGEKDPYESIANLPARLGEVMLDELPEVQYMTRFSTMEYGTIHCNKRAFKEKIAFVDSGFFKMFSFPLLYGDRNTVFKNPSDAVITEEIAKKYFGDENPIGKILTYSYETEQIFTVAGVIQSPSANSSLQFKILLPAAARPWFEDTRKSWEWAVYPTFVQVEPGTDARDFKSRLDVLSDKYMTDVYGRLRDMQSIPEHYKVGEFDLIPLKDIHFASHVGWDKVSDPRYSWILGGIAILIVVVACINYISLALTTSVSRRIEVGIRKVIGAKRNQLMYQFSFESLILAFFSMILGFGFVLLFLPFFNEFTGKAIELSVQRVVSISGVSILLTMVIGILAAVYPSLIISGFLPAQVLKGIGSRVNMSFTKPLVGFQFFFIGFVNYLFGGYDEANAVHHNQKFGI